MIDAKTGAVAAIFRTSIDALYIVLRRTDIEIATLLSENIL